MASPAVPSKTFFACGLNLQWLCPLPPLVANSSRSALLLLVFESKDNCEPLPNFWLVWPCFKAVISPIYWWTQQYYGVYVPDVPMTLSAYSSPILKTTATCVPAVPGAASDSGYAAQFAAYIACWLRAAFPSGRIHAAASHPSSISPRQRVTAGS